MKSYLYDFVVLGDDMRQIYLLEMLKEKGYSVCSSISCIHDANVIIAPTPFLEEKIGDVKTLLHKGQFFFAGCIPEDFKEDVLKKGVIVFDFMKYKKVAIANSVATAEGVIAEAIRKSTGNLRGSTCTVLGYGICAKTIVSTLKGMGAKVIVCARKEEARAFASLVADKVFSMEQMGKAIEKSDYIFNTVPDKILLESQLKCVKSHGIILDIASGTGGVDFERAKDMGVKAYHCKALPGVYAPRESAKILLHVILEYSNLRKGNKGV